MASLFCIKKLHFLTCDTLICNINMIEYKTFTIEFIYNVLFLDIFWKMLCKMHLFLNFIVLGLYRIRYLKLSFIHYIFNVSAFTVLLMYGILYLICNYNSRFSSWVVLVSWLACSIWIFFCSHWTYGGVVYHARDPWDVVLNIYTHSSWRKFIIQVEYHRSFSITDHSNLCVLNWMSTIVQV